MRGYPLQAFLVLLKRREDDAQQAVTQARKRVGTCVAALAARKRELENYKQWCVDEAARLFREIQGKSVRHQKIMDDKLQVSLNESQIPVYEKAVADAEKRLAEEREALAQCIRRQQAASKEVYKVENHKAMWKTSQMKEIETAEEAANEETAETAFAFRRHD